MNLTPLVPDSKDAIRYVLHDGREGKENPTCKRFPHVLRGKRVEEGRPG